MVTITNWGLVPRGTPYTAPELRRIGFNGTVCGSGAFEDGTNITTSAVVQHLGGLRFKTATGSEYELGEVNPEYEQMFPNALQRLIDALHKSALKV